MSLRPRYEEDFYSWAHDQAAALRQAAAARVNVPEAIDWENLAEEVEALGRSELRELWSRYYRLNVHLLKWLYQPEGRSAGWRGTIREQRKGIEKLLRDSPGLKPRQQAVFEEAYADARALAADETGLPVATFPPACPFTLEEATDPDFLPEEGEQR